PFPWVLASSVTRSPLAVSMLNACANTLCTVPLSRNGTASPMDSARHAWVSVGPAGTVRRPLASDADGGQRTSGVRNPAEYTALGFDHFKREFLELRKVRSDTIGQN